MEAPLLPDSGPFLIGDRVLVPHSEKYYDAKILKARKRDDGLWYYLIHYTGWNKKWDEWIEETGLRRVPDEGLPPALALGEGANSRGTLQSGKGGPEYAGRAPGAPTGGRKVAKSKRPDRDGTEMDVELSLEVYLPASMKDQLLLQYDAVHDEGKLLPLPRRPNVRAVLQQYTAWVRTKQDSSAAEDELVSGLQVYFDKALYQCLLYKAERHQAEQVLLPGQAPSAVYGAEHLLRLCVKMPELMPYTGIDEEDVLVIIKRLDDLVAFLHHQAARLFVPAGDYVPASSAAAVGHAGRATGEAQTAGS